LYAFGVMLAQVVRGRSPFADFDSLTSLLLAKSAHVPPATVDARPGLHVPRALHDLIERLLRPHPRARPRFAVEVRAELSALLAEVRDEVESVAPFEPERSARPTAIDLAEAPVEESGALALPAFLPAADDLALGAGIARLR